MKCILLILAVLLASIPKMHAAPVPTYYPNTYYDARQMGVDCTGKTDSSTALQAAINTVPDGGALLFQTGCNVKLSSTINIISRKNLRLASYQTTQPEGHQPTFNWTDPGAVIQATVSGTVMTVNSVSSGTLKVGDVLQGPGTGAAGVGINANGPGNPYIVSFGTFNGTSGTVNLSTSATIGSPTTFTATGTMFNVEVRAGTLSLTAYSSPTAHRPPVRSECL